MGRFRFTAASLLVLLALLGPSIGRGGFAPTTMNTPPDAHYITSCTNITSPGLYVLGSDIRGVQANGYYCIGVFASNVTLDGDGHRLFGPGLYHGVGIYVNGSSSNVTIEDVEVTDYLVGLKVTGGSHDVIYDVVADNDSLGLYVTGSHDVVNGSSFMGDYVGLELYDSSGDLIYDNLFNSSSFYIVNSWAYWNVTLRPGRNILGGNVIGGNAWLSPSGAGFSQLCAPMPQEPDICSKPFNLVGNNTDYLPLAYPQGALYTATSTTTTTTTTTSTTTSTSTTTTSSTTTTAAQTTTSTATSSATTSTATAITSSSSTAAAPTGRAAAITYVVAGIVVVVAAVAAAIALLRRR